MKFLQPFSLIILFTIQLSTLATAQTVNALAGTYTIGTPTADFPDFATAFNTLADEGISDAVTFSVIAGTYTEDVVLRFFPNSGNHPLVVESDGDAIIEGLFTINTASNVTLRRLQLRAAQKAIEIRGNCDLVTFDQLDILINNGEQVSFSYHIVVIGELTNFRLQNSVLRGGEAGIFNDQIGGELQDAVIENNQIDVAERAIHLHKCENITVRNNQINKELLWIPGVGNNNMCLLLSECSGLIQVEQNRLFGHQKRLIEVSSMTVNDQLSIINNYGYLYTTGTYATTAAVVLYDIPKLDFIFNTIINQVGGQQLTIRATDPQHNILNNILQSDRSATLLSLDYTGTTNAIIDNNLYYNANNAFRNYYNGQLFTNLSEWQTQTGLDANAVNAPVTFAVMDSYQTNDTNIQNAGEPQAAITVDIEGNQRKANEVSIGAFETNYVRQNDAGITQIDVPNIPFAAGEHPLFVELTNFGDTPLQSVEIEYHINGNVQTFAWTGNLGTDVSETVDLGMIIYTPLTNNEVVVTTKSPNGVVDEFVYNDELAKTELYPALAGDYSVGTMDSDFADLLAAIDYLDLGGVVGATNLNLADGTYQERDGIIFKPILGTSITNRITIQSAAQDATMVTWIRGGSRPYAFLLEGVQFIDFKHLTFDIPNQYNQNYALLFTEGGGEIEISYCNFIGQVRAEFIVGLHEDNDTPNSIYQNINIHHNVFTGGEKSIYFNDELADDVDFNISNINIHNNQFKEQNIGIWFICVHQSRISDNVFIDYNYGMFLNACSDFVVRNNQLQGGGSNFQGITIRGSHNINDDNKIINNYIEIGETPYSKNGLIIQRLHNAQVIHNTIRSVAIDNPQNVTLLSVINQQENVNIQNNLFTTTGGSYIGHNIDEQTTNLNWNNNIYDGSPDNFARISENNQQINYENLTDWQNASNHDLDSRIIDPDYLQPNGYVVQNQAVRVVTDPDATATAGNDIEDQMRPTSYLAMAGVYEAMPSGTDLAVVGFADLGIYQLPDNQTISIEVVNLGNTTINDISVSWNVNGDAQPTSDHTINLAPFASTTVEIGQFTFVAGETYQFSAMATPVDVTDEYLTNNEYTLPEVFVRMVGNYTVGGTNPDIIDVATAFEKLQKHGIAGEVTFAIRSGDYTARPILRNYYSHLVDHQVIFKAEDDATVNITIERENSRRKGMEIEQINKLSFIGLNFYTPYEEYFSVIHLEDTDHISFFNCKFNYNGPIQNTVSSTAIIRIVNQDDNLPLSHFTVTKCNFDTRRIALFFETKMAINQPTAINISENYFLRCTSVLTGMGFDNLLFQKNTVEWADVEGRTKNLFSSSTINVNDVGNLQILNNRFYAKDDGFARICIGAIKDNFDRSLLANNLMVVTDPTKEFTFQLYFYETTDLDVLHNTIFSTDRRRNAIVIENSATTQLNIYNNIFSTTTSRVMSIYGNTDINWDYNVYFHPDATQFAYKDNQVINNFTDWQNTETTDLNSQNVDPEFNSAYYPMALSVQNAAQYNPRVTTDLDGKPRDTNHPDPGAFENFSNELPLAIQNIHLQTKMINQKKVKLIWQDEGTKEITHYQIERSKDGRIFQAIGQQNAKRSGQYQFEDASPSIGQNYYRLHYQNIVGEVGYSNIASAAMLSPVVKVFPNPTTDFITIKLIEPTTELGIIITDMAGKEVYRSNDKRLHQKIDVRDWASGSYSIRIKTDMREWIEQMTKL